MFKNILIKNKIFIFSLLLVILGLTFVYRDAVFKGKILFPSNLLASFYSPWSTYHFPGWGLGIPNKPIGGNDNVRIFYPARTFSNKQISQGLMPVWNPYIFSGSPHLANFQSAVFYPLNFLYFLFPQIIAWSLLVILPFILGFIGMYLFLNSCKLEKFSSIIGAISFSFSGFIITWTQENAAMGQSALWLPFMLWSTEKLVQSKKIIYALLLSIILACPILGGFYQITFYCYIVVFFYGIYRILQTKINQKYLFLIFIVSLLFSFCLSAIQLLPSAEAFFQSPRSSSSAWYLFDQYLLPLTHFIHGLIPNMFGNPGTYSYFGKGFYHETIFYLGIIPLIFAVFAFSFIKKNKYILFFTIASIISYFFTIKNPITIWFFKLSIPFVTTFLPSRILFITSSMLSILAAFGISYYLTNSNQQDKKKLLKICLFFTILIFVVILSIVINYYYSIKIFAFIENYICDLNNKFNLGQIKILLKNSVIPLVILFTCLFLTQFPIKRKIIVFVFLIITALGQFYFLNKYSVTGYSEFLYPEHFIFSYLQKQNNDFSRFIAFGRPIMGNVSVDKEIYTTEGMDAVFPNRYGQLATAAKNDGQIISDIPRIEVTLSELGESESMLHNAKRLRLISLLSTKYIFFYMEKPLTQKQLEDKFPKSVFESLWQQDNWNAYLNKQSLPRVFLVNKYIVETDPQKITDKFFDPNMDVAKTVILEEQPVENLNISSTDINTSNAEIIKYKPEYVEISTQTSNPQILFLSDNYYPGWEATIDNIPTKIYRADYTFRAVVVPQGNHKIVFSYYPKNLKIGLYITCFSVGLSLSGLAYLLYSKIKKV